MNYNIAFKKVGKIYHISFVNITDIALTSEEQISLVKEDIKTLENEISCLQKTANVLNQKRNLLKDLKEILTLYENDLKKEI